MEMSVEDGGLRDDPWQRFIGAAVGMGEMVQVSVEELEAVGLSSAVLMTLRTQQMSDHRKQHRKPLVMKRRRKCTSKNSLRWFITKRNGETDIPIPDLWTY